MQDQPNETGDSPTGSQDLKDQGTVLAHVLALHPTNLPIPALVRELNNSEDFAGSDAVERAVRDLTGIGLLDCPCGVVKPTRAALHFDRLSSL